MESERPVLYVVVPCFNEEAVVDDTAEELDGVLKAMTGKGLIGAESRILFVDDGSTDRTWEKIQVLSARGPRIGGIALRPHAGHQTAMYAGLMESKAYCDAAVTMDADLQDDPAILPAMVEQLLAGKDVVYAVRKRRKGDPLWKRATAWLFYRSMPVMGIHMPKDCGEYRLLSKRALECLSLFKEPDPFLRGLLPLLGLPSGEVLFDRRPRRAGESRYPFRKAAGLAAGAVVSLSPWPLHLLFWLGTGIALPAFLRLFWLLFSACPRSGQPGAGASPVPGWEIAVMSIWAAAGLLLMGMGILGAYLWQIWRQIAGRPRGQVAEAVNVGQARLEADRIKGERPGS